MCTAPLQSVDKFGSRFFTSSEESLPACVSPASCDSMTSLTRRTTVVQVSTSGQFQHDTNCSGSRFFLVSPTPTPPRPPLPEVDFNSHRMFRVPRVAAKTERRATAIGLVACSLHQRSAPLAKSKALSSPFCFWIRVKLNKHTPNCNHG